MKYFLFYILSLSVLLNFGQDSIKYYNIQIISNYKQHKFKQSDSFFKTKIFRLKQNNNLEEFYYSYLDYFWLDAKKQRFYLFKDAEKEQWRLPVSENEKIAKLHFILNKAYQLKQHFAISKSVLEYEKALNYYQKNKLNSYDIVEYCLKPLANNYTRLGDFNRADVLLKYTVTVAENKKNIQQLIATYINLSITYQSVNKHKEAIKLLEKALELSKKSTFQKNDIYTQIAKNLFELKQYDKAIKTAKKAITLNQNNKSVCSNLSTIASCYFLKGNFKKAIYFFKKATKKTTNKRVKAKIYNQQAKVYIALKRYENALAKYQKALQILIPDFKPENTYENPNKTKLYPENTFVEILDGKAAIYQILDKYKAAISCYKLSALAENLLRKTFSSQEAKLSQVSNSKARIEKILNLYSILLKETKSNSKKQNILKNMLSTVDKNKATVLSDVLYEKEKYNNINNDSLLVKKQDLELKQANYENAIALEELKNTKASIEKIKGLIKKKVATTTNIQLLKQKIQKKYNLSFTKKNFDIIKFQKNILLKNQIFIIYFNTKEQLYIFKLTKNKINFRVLKKNKKFKNTLQSFINLFAQGSSKELNNKITDYKKQAKDLYDYLLKPELENNTKNILTIIPDGKLNFLAFDSLLTEKTTTNNFEKMPFLLKKIKINYGYSLSILTQQFYKNTFANLKSFSGFFPVFKDNHQKLQELSYTVNERNAIKKYISGKFFSNEKATKKTFLKEAENTNILHISTHASAGGFYNSATIKFYDKTLYLPEIYGLQLQTDLLVLSACETGIGKLNKSEGAISLARGFSYAGVKNLLVSQWKVNDKATSILMASFYKNYKKTISKNEALHQAKLDYLKDNSISSLKKSPYYWAGFIFVGNATVPQSYSYFSYTFISVFVVFLILVLLYRFNV